MTMRMVVLAAAAAALASGCASTAPLTASPSVETAGGSATFSRTDDGNTQVELQVERLAEPAHKTPGRNVYVVWVQGEQGPPQNVGAIEVDETQRGELDTVSPVEEGELFITSEESGDVQQPSGERLMWTEFGD